MLGSFMLIVIGCSVLTIVVCSELLTSGCSMLMIVGCSALLTNGYSISLVTSYFEHLDVEVIMESENKDAGGTPNPREVRR